MGMLGEKRRHGKFRVPFGTAMSQLAPTFPSQTSSLGQPYSVTRACSELPFNEHFSDLPDSHLRVVFKIVQKISVSSPFRPIFASRGTLAKEAGKSLDSVSRALSWLEEHGFIERERKARAGLRGSTSPIKPTQAFLQALLFVDETGAPHQKARAADEVRAPSTSAMLPPSAPQTNPRGVFSKVNGALIPVELTWLVSRGVSAFGVLRLMRLARDSKQYLSHVVEASRKYLDKLHSRQLFAYLQKIIKSGQDFKEIVEKSSNTERDAREQEYVRNKAVDLEGRTFRSNTKTYRVEDGAVRVFDTSNKHLGMRPVDRSFLELISTGKLVGASE